VSAAQTVVSVAKQYSTYEEALAALKEISCFFLPPPIDLGCAAIVAEQEAGVFILAQASQVLFQAGFCVTWGACNLEVTTSI
jgi:hypothetical protein